MSDLERNFKKQKFLEKIESILDHDNETELISFFRTLLTKKGYIVQLEALYQAELSRIRDETIHELQHVDRDAIIAALPPVSDENLVSRRNFFNEANTTKEIIKLDAKEFQVHTFSKEFEVNIDSTFDPKQSNEAIRSGLDRCMDSLIRAAVADGAVEVKKIYDPKSHLQRTTLTLKALRKL